MDNERDNTSNCSECGQQPEHGYRYCRICYWATRTYEGIVIGAVRRYFDGRFEDFSTQREYEIQIGSRRCRADIGLLDNEGKLVAIAECKRIGYDGNDGIGQLKAYLNASGTELGLFADDTDPYGWTFLKEVSRGNFELINRSQFERELGIEPVPEIPPIKTQLEIVHGNIIEAKVDAIVTTANSQLTRGTGIDDEIRNVGGEEIDSKCQEIIEHEGFRPLGDAVITTGGNLTARYVIHAVGPVYSGGGSYEAEALASCYKNSLQLAVGNGIQSIAFPAISTGNFRYPIEQAAPVALRSVKEFVEQAHQNNEMVPELIQFVLFDQEAYACYVKELSNLGVGLSCQIG